LHLLFQYYRQLNAGSPRAAIPVVYGSPVPSNIYGSPPVMQPQTMGFIAPTRPHLVGPSVAPVSIKFERMKLILFSKTHCGYL